jgi:hypothetical protein
MEGGDGGEVSEVNATMVAPCSGVVRMFQGARTGGVGRTVNSRTAGSCGDPLSALSFRVRPSPGW